MCTNKMQ